MKKIYMITNTNNGLRYIGRSNDPEVRFEIHLRSLRGGYHYNSKMLSDYINGDIFTMDIIGEGDSSDEARIIKEIGDYNVIGKPVSDETKSKMSQSKIGKQSVRKGTKCTKETRERIRVSLIGNTRAKKKVVNV